MAFHVSQLGNLTCCRSEAQMSASPRLKFHAQNFRVAFRIRRPGASKGAGCAFSVLPATRIPCSDPEHSPKARAPSPKGSRGTFWPLMGYSIPSSSLPNGGSGSSPTGLARILT